MVGRGFWIVIWSGLLLVGLLGLWASAYWGRRTAWRNLDEIFRALGTVTVSAGILGLLTGHEAGGRVFLGAALVCFVVAMVAFRVPDRSPEPADPSSSVDQAAPRPQAAPAPPVAVGARPGPRQRTEV